MSRGANRSPRTEAQRIARDERLARALRDNLKRRKEQARAQAGSAGERDAALSSEALSSKSTRRGGATAD